MKELSVFIDESGDFGEYDDQAPYYIITIAGTVTKQLLHCNFQNNGGWAL